MIHSEIGIDAVKAGLPQRLALFPEDRIAPSTEPRTKVPVLPALDAMIAENVREPLLALDASLNVIFSSNSFDASFGIVPKHVSSLPFFTLGNGVWDIPALRSLLESAQLRRNGSGDCEVEATFSRIGPRVLTVHARHLDGDTGAILLSFEDITSHRAQLSELAGLLREAQNAVRQNETRLAEVQHRVLNSLQIIASILIMKARAITSPEAHKHLLDAHRRIMTVAAVQRHLQNAGLSDYVEVTPYLTKLCEVLSGAMIEESHPVRIVVTGDASTRVAADVVSIGLIVSELVVNALKYAFPRANSDATIQVHFESGDADWKLTVRDNGVGKSAESASNSGLGGNLVRALGRQLNAEVVSTSSSRGMCIVVAHNLSSCREAILPI